MKAKAFVCLHGFGDHSGGRRPGFSAALRRAVESRLGANHRFYWKSPDVAESVAAAAVAACSQAGEPPATAEAFELLSRAVEDSLWSAGEEFEFDEDGNIVGVSVS